MENKKTYVNLSWLVYIFMGVVGFFLVRFFFDELNLTTVYDLDLLKRMYKYLNKHGDLFYIKYKNRLCGDVCLQPSGEVNIVIAKPFQNKHIGRRVIKEIIQLAKEKQIPELHAEIYTFNTQSQKKFQSIGFAKVDDEQYALVI